MKHTIKIRELISRPIIRSDKPLEFLNKMTDEEIEKLDSDIETILLEEGVERKYPIWNEAAVTKMIDRDTMYNLFKHVDAMRRGEISKKDVWIGLTRLDLQKHKEDVSIDDVTVFDFKSSSLTREQMNEASFIVFEDEGVLKELKNKYASWPLK